jgi:hypothetical protein
MAMLGAAAIVAVSVVALGRAGIGPLAGSAATVIAETDDETVTDTPPTDEAAAPAPDTTPTSPPPRDLAKTAGEGQPVELADATATTTTPTTTTPSATETPVNTPPPVVEDAALKAAISEARGLYERGKLKAAGESLKKLNGSQSSHPDVLLLTAQVMLERSQLEDAMRAAQRCVKLAATQADCWLTLGVLHQNGKDKPAALAAYEKYLALAPSGRYVRDASSQLNRLRKQ